MSGDHKSPNNKFVALRKRHTYLGARTRFRVASLRLVPPDDGIGEPGSEIAKLVGHGFVEISTANAGLGVI
jgi:hypothetical protein